MKKLLIIFLSIPIFGFSQTACSYNSNTEAAASICNSLNGKTSSFSSNIEAELALEKILTALRIPRNFALVECNGIENCIALTHNGVKYILYDKFFMQELANINEIDDFIYSSAKLSVLAHEIGHHVYGHTDNLETISLKESRRMELEADEFSGAAMYKLGASLQQAQMAVIKKSSEIDDTYSTHPKKSKRLAAIAKGYSKNLTRYNYDLGAYTLNVQNLSLDDSYNLTMSGTYKGKPYSGYAYELCSEKQKNPYYIRNNITPACVKQGTEKTFRYFKNGKIISIRQYITEDYYYGRGKYVDRFYKKDGSVEQISYWNDGIVKEKYHEKGGMFKEKDGLRIAYKEDGNLDYLSTYTMGKKDGWDIRYGPSLLKEGSPNIHYISNQYFFNNGEFCPHCIEYEDFVNFFSDLDIETINYIYLHQFRSEQNDKKNNLFYTYYNRVLSEMKKEEDINFMKILNNTDECLKYLSYNIDNCFQIYEEIYRYRGEANDALGLSSCDDYKQACIAGHMVYSDYDNFCKYHKSCY